jgi:hypothetical protein
MRNIIRQVKHHFNDPAELTINEIRRLVNKLLFSVFGNGINIGRLVLIQLADLALRGFLVAGYGIMTDKVKSQLHFITISGFSIHIDNDPVLIRHRDRLETLQTAFLSIVAP